jgi:hypothetical protein
MRWNVAVTLADAVTETVQVLPVPPHDAPDQPTNSEPALTAAVSVTLVPWSKLAPHWPEEQEIPLGCEETEPLPVPASVTVS